MIDGIIKMMNSNDDIVGPINLGNDCEITINELAEKVIDLTNSESKIVYKELPQDDPIKRKPDLTLAREILGYSPNISIDEGIKRTMEYYNNMKN